MNFFQVGLIMQINLKKAKDNLNKLEMKILELLGHSFD